MPCALRADLIAAPNCSDVSIIFPDREIMREKYAKINKITRSGRFFSAIQPKPENIPIGNFLSPQPPSAKGNGLAL
jgi:hypothetical protein